MDKLIGIRDQIDQIDQEIVALLDHRTKLATRLAQLKTDEGRNIHDPNRERQVIKKVKCCAKEPVVKQNIEVLYEQVMRMSKINQLATSRNSLPFHHIGIVGRGMMGGSIQKALKQVDANLEVSFVDDVKRVDSSVDLLILAIPTSEVLKLTREVAKYCSDLTVIDIASVKLCIANLFEELSSHTVEFVATHPMAGSEKSGIAYSNSGLFFGCRWIISAHENNRPKTLTNVEKLIHCLQAEVVYLDAKSHDQKIGLVSHMMRVLSSSLYAFTVECDPMSLEVAGPGFRSMTRLAHGEERLLDEVVIYNRENVVNHLGGLIDHLNQVKNRLTGDPKQSMEFQEYVS